MPKTATCLGRGRSLTGLLPCRARQPHIAARRLLWGAPGLPGVEAAVVEWPQAICDMAALPLLCVARAGALPHCHPPAAGVFALPGARPAATPGAPLGVGGRPARGSPPCGLAVRCVVSERGRAASWSQSVARPENTSQLAGSPPQFGSEARAAAGPWPHVHTAVTVLHAGRSLSEPVVGSPRARGPDARPGSEVGAVGETPASPGRPEGRPAASEAAARPSENTGDSRGAPGAA